MASSTQAVFPPAISLCCAPQTTVLETSPPALSAAPPNDQRDLCQPCARPQRAQAEKINGRLYSVYIFLGVITSVVPLVAVCGSPSVINGGGDLIELHEKQKGKQLLAGIIRVLWLL